MTTRPNLLLSKKLQKRYSFFFFFVAVSIWSLVFFENPFSNACKKKNLIKNMFVIKITKKDKRAKIEGLKFEQ
jgi:hypothetical protein